MTIAEPFLRKHSPNKKLNEEFFPLPEIGNTFSKMAAKCKLPTHIRK